MVVMCFLCDENGNFDFKLNLTLKVKVNLSQIFRNLKHNSLHLWSKFDDAGLYGYGWCLWCGQAQNETNIDI